MKALTERLEVRLSPETIRLLREEAQQKKIPVALLVREAIDTMFREKRQSKLAAAEALFQVESPVSDWPVMKKEIENAHSGAHSQ